MIEPVNTSNINFSKGRHATKNQKMIKKKMSTHRHRVQHGAVEGDREPDEGAVLGENFLDDVLLRELSAVSLQVDEDFGSLLG